MTLLLVQPIEGIILLQPHMGPGNWPSSTKVVPEKQSCRSPEVTQGSVRATRRVEEAIARILGEEGCLRREGGLA